VIESKKIWEEHRRESEKIIKDQDERLKELKSIPENQRTEEENKEINTLIGWKEARAKRGY